MIDVHRTSLSPWEGKFCPLKAPWNHNPLEEEDHWIPLHEHHPQAMFAHEDLDLHEGPCLLQSANGEAYEEDPPCFSPAVIAETLLHQSLNPTKAAAAAAEEETKTEAKAEAAEDSRSFLPVAEVLWKPSSVKPSGLLEQLEMEVPRMITSPATKPDSWSFTSEDDHPRPESGSVPHSMNFEDQPWAQLAESSVDEVTLFDRFGPGNEIFINVIRLSISLIGLFVRRCCRMIIYWLFCIWYQKQFPTCGECLEVVVEFE